MKELRLAIRNLRPLLVRWAVVYVALVSVSSIYFIASRNNSQYQRVSEPFQKQIKIAEVSDKTPSTKSTVSNVSTSGIINNYNGVWDRLSKCESSNNWSINTGNGYYGGLQFKLSSWQLAGGSGYPHEASKDEQIDRGEKLKDIQGWKAWPECSLKLGLR